MIEINSLLQNCYFCKQTVQSDPKYHQYYIDGKLVGIMHRRCSPFGKV
jgi:hypothetical protein